MKWRYCMKTPDIQAIASMIDHTILKSDAAREQVAEYCRLAIKYGFASVCVSPCHVPLAKKELKDSGVKVCTVIGFPLGADSSDAKAFAAKTAVRDGADEIDMVLNIGAVKDGDFDYVEKEIREVVTASGNALVKVIIETCYLTDDEKVMACRAAVNAGAGFVKTSTGFGPAGATASDVRLMRDTVGEGIGVKASGGIRSSREAMEMIEAGADRIGTSSGVRIIKELLKMQ
jgi:deoxyribose-phosphate aldolase